MRLSNVPGWFSTHNAWSPTASDSGCGPESREATTLRRTVFRYKLRPKRVIADTAYGTVENLLALEADGIKAFMPLPDWEKSSHYYRSSAFTYDIERDVYVCPYRHGRVGLVSDSDMVRLIISSVQCVASASRVIRALERNRTGVGPGRVSSK
jgi:hypothetical protein